LIRGKFYLLSVIASPAPSRDVAISDQMYIDAGVRLLRFTRNDAPLRALVNQSPNYSKHTLPQDHARTNYLLNKPFLIF